MAEWTLRILSDTVTPTLERLKTRLLYELRMELDVVGQEMVDLALSLVPRRTGFLASTIFHDFLTEELVMRFGAKAEYAAWVEMGTRTMAPRPFIRPALDGCWPRVQEAARVALANAAR